MCALIGGSKSNNFEKVETGVWINSQILNVEDRVNPNKKYLDKETGETKTKSVDEVRIVFQLIGYDVPKYSRWMTFSTFPKATLYKDFLKNIAPNTPENEIVDLSKLIGVKVKLMYKNEKGKDGKEYNNIVLIEGIETDNLDIRVEGAPF